MGRYSVPVRMNGRTDIVKMSVLPRAIYITYTNLQNQRKLHQHLNDIIHRNRKQNKTTTTKKNPNLHRTTEDPEPKQS